VFLLYAFVFKHPGLLFEDKFSDANGRCGLGGEHDQQALIVWFVFLAAEAFSEIEQADELARLMRGRVIQVLVRGEPGRGGVA